MEVEIKCSYDELVPIERIVRNPKNNNRHSVEQIKRLAKILEYQGIRSPLVVSKNSGFLNCGHGRLDAFELLGIKEVPVNYQEFENDAQEYAHMTADNEIARWAELDWQALYDDMNEIEIDSELLGVKYFKLPDADGIEDAIKSIDDENAKFVLEVQFPNDSEMNDTKDELSSRGFMCKVK